MKQDTVNNLLSNAEFLFDALIGLVNEESSRIMQHKLAEKKDLDGFVIPVLKSAANNQDKEQALKALSRLHSELQKIKLPNDFKKIAGFVEIEIVPINKDMYSLKPLVKDEECCEGCDGPCCNIEEEPVKLEEPNEQDEDLELKSYLAVELEKIAFEAGSNGNHNAAYIIESFIKNIK